MDEQAETAFFWENILPPQWKCSDLHFKRNSIEMVWNIHVTFTFVPSIQQP